jgi:hypothetical protein
MDIFDMLARTRQAEPAASALPVLSLWRQATYYLMFFTLTPDRFGSHYDEEGKSAYLCLGEGCPACGAGVRATDHVYLPVWDAQNRRVAVLKFHTGDNGPAEKILGFLKTYREQLADVVAVVDCEGGGQFSITAHKPLPETDRGALACEQFVRGVERGAITLRSCVKRLTAGEVARLPGVEGRAKPAIGPAVPPAAMAPVAPDEPVATGQPVPPPPTNGGV